MTNLTTLTVDEKRTFYAALNRHDWFFEYSDDYGVWRRGNENETMLRTMANTHPELRALYDAFRDSVMNGKPRPVRP